MHTTNRNDAADLLDQVRAFVARFWAAPSEAALDALVLWGASTHATIDAVMAVAEDAGESGETSPELVENALALIDDYCHCA